MDGLRYGDYVYMPVLKNASSTYMKFFREMGWVDYPQHLIRKNENLKLFGHIQNPDVRHTKGLVEWAFLTGAERYFFDINLAPLLCSGMHDNHTNSLSHYYSDLIYRIHWIPMDISIPVHELTNDYMKENGLSFTVDESYNFNESGESKKEKYKRVQQIKKKLNDRLQSNLIIILHRDIELWEDAKQNYEEKYRDRLSN